MSLEEHLLADSGPLPKPEQEGEISIYLPVNFNSRKQKDVLLEAATVDLEFVGELPLNELSSKSFVTIAFPILFPDGKGDQLQIPQLFVIFQRLNFCFEN